MSTPILICVKLTLVCLVGTLYAEKTKNTTLKRVCKPLASIGFIGAAYFSGALESQWGVAIFVGLCLSFWGDVFLMWREQLFFRLGLFSFLLGHVAYAVGFVMRGVDGLWLAAAGTGLAIVGAGILRWLWPHVTGRLKGPVVAYVAVISVMLALALATHVAAALPILLLGAFLFYLSDISVARDRFMGAGFINRAWGLPAYYIGQLLIAYSTGC